MAQPELSIRSVVKMEARGCTRDDIAKFLEDYRVLFDGARLWVSSIIGENGDGWYCVGLTENDRLCGPTLEACAASFGKSFDRETCTFAPA